MKNKEKYDLNTLKIEWTPQTSERNQTSQKKYFFKGTDTNRNWYKCI